MERGVEISAKQHENASFREVVTCGTRGEAETEAYQVRAGVMSVFVETLREYEREAVAIEVDPEKLGISTEIDMTNVIRGE